MKYEGMIFRPPSEAESLILQVTVGCSYNRCTFCGAYRGKTFRVKRFEEIKEDIDEVSVYPIRRVFLADGDALIIPQKELLQILSYLKEKLKGLERIGIYANAKDILRKDVEELKALRDLGLGIIYLGLESGDPAILKRIKKNATVDQLIRAGKRVKESGILLSVTVILGLGGVEGSQTHAQETGKVLSEMDPDYAGALSLMIVPGTPIEQEIETGRLVLPTPFELIQELETMIENSHMTHCFFASNHASNYLPLRIQLPEEKEDALRRIREVLKRRDPALLRPEYLRAL
ncbi:MAG: radical SAM protein [Deltaproteobacteria bacterium]|nr:radical SAM protein [Deltaproteobacteria bacterium]MBM4323150.1 radical SAM protein [Deltaproteobacteria bacterium]